MWQPIVVDRYKNIIIGHTRYEALKRMGEKTAPVLFADALTEEQANALRLADNRTHDLAQWDIDKLEEELSGIEIDMGMFGFDPAIVDKMLDDADRQMQREAMQGDARPYGTGDDAQRDGTAPDRVAPEPPEYYGAERERTFDAYNLYDFDATRTAGAYQMPCVGRCDTVPERLIGFNYMLSSQNTDCGVHFFIDDYQFERLWNRPHEYMERLRAFQCVLTPDFSLYMDMPVAMKIWNVYRSRLIGQIMSDYGIPVIPTLTWAEPESYTYCFDGLEPGGVYAVSTIGVKRDDKALSVWQSGMTEAIKRLHPATLILYGGMVDFDFGDVTVKEIANEVNERWRGRVDAPTGKVQG